MTERESFVASMRDNPADDTARLAFADWLDERGEHDRAELIRVQVARARLNPRPVLRVWQQIHVTAPVHGGREFRGDFLGARGLRLTPGLTFDAVMSMAPGEPLKTKAVGCVIEQFGPPISASETIWLAGHVTGIPCPVRPEADALDERAAALMLKMPFGEFCPETFNWFVDADGFDTHTRESQSHAPALPAPAVLVRRGFAEHVRCSWEDWVRWADWFRANHPCERVTLTTGPKAEVRREPLSRTYEVSLPGVVRARWQFSEEEVNLARGGGFALVRGAVGKLIREQWPGTSFALPGQHFPMEVPPNAISDYTAQLFGTIAQGLGIPPNLVNGGTGT